MRRLAMVTTALWQRRSVYNLMSHSKVERRVDGYHSTNLRQIVLRYERRLPTTTIVLADASSCQGSRNRCSATKGLKVHGASGPASDRRPTSPFEGERKMRGRCARRRRRRRRQRRRAAAAVGGAGREGRRRRRRRGRKGGSGGSSLEIVNLSSIHDLYSPPAARPASLSLAIVSRRARALRSWRRRRSAIARALLPRCLRRGDAVPPRRRQLNAGLVHVLVLRLRQL